MPPSRTKGVAPQRRGLPPPHAPFAHEGGGAVAPGVVPASYPQNLPIQLPDRTHIEPDRVIIKPLGIH